MQIFAIASTLSVLLGSALAAPMEKRCTGDYGYATFYDDNACTQNPGEAVSMGNSGCLANEYGRNSIYIQGGCIENPWLVWSPGNDCNCQNECQSVPAGDDFCWNLNGNQPAESFRFITQSCGGNNC